MLYTRQKKDTHLKLHFIEFIRNSRKILSLNFNIHAIMNTNKAVKKLKNTNNVVYL